MRIMDSRIDDTDSTQASWRFCKNCYQLFYAGVNNGKCPLTGGGHENSISYYVLNFVPVQPPPPQGYDWCVYVLINGNEILHRETVHTDTNAKPDDEAMQLTIDWDGQSYTIDKGRCGG
jgi:hypothetical protein